MKSSCWIFDYSRIAQNFFGFLIVCLMSALFKNSVDYANYFRDWYRPFAFAHDPGARLAYSFIYLINAPISIFVLASGCGYLFVVRNSQNMFVKCISLFTYSIMFNMLITTRVLPAILLFQLCLNGKRFLRWKDFLLFGASSSFHLSVGAFAPLYLIKKRLFFWVSLFTISASFFCIDYCWDHAFYRLILEIIGVRFREVGLLKGGESGFQFHIILSVFECLILSQLYKEERGLSEIRGKIWGTVILVCVGILYYDLMISRLLHACHLLNMLAIVNYSKRTTFLTVAYFCAQLVGAVYLVSSQKYFLPFSPWQDYILCALLLVSLLLVFLWITTFLFTLSIRDAYSVRDTLGWPSSTLVFCKGRRQKAPPSQASSP